MRVRFTFIISLILIFCSPSINSDTFNISSLDYETIKFDVVSKKIFYDDSLDKDIQYFIQKFFDNNIKVNGFEGNMDLQINNYFENINNIENGKKIELSLEFIININKSLKSERSNFKGKVNSYGKMTGNFSLNDFEALKKEVKSELVSRLSKSLKSKF